METQVEVEEEGKEGLETRIDEPEFEPETAKESSQHALGKSLVTAAAAVLRRHKNTRKNTWKMDHDPFSTLIFLFNLYLFLFFWIFLLISVHICMYVCM